MSVCAECGRQLVDLVGGPADGTTAHPPPTDDLTPIVAVPGPTSPGGFPTGLRYRLRPGLWVADYEGRT